MDGRLLEAALSGNTESLLELVQENPLVLATAALTSGETPLHIAALNGHVDFTKAILQLRPAFARELNQDGFSPMHMASANGHLDIVTLFLEFGRDHAILHELCVQKSMNGRIPLRYPVIKGRVNVIGELLSDCLESVQELTDQGETVLHLAVKNNQREGFKFLAQEQSAIELVNLMDEEGNSVLHLATVLKQCQILLSLPNVNVNAANSKGLASLDVFLIVPCLSDDIGIGEMLRATGGVKSQNLQLSMIQHQTRRNVNGSTSDSNVLKPEDWLKEMRSGILMMTTLTATFTFQAALTPPSGFWQDWGVNNSTASISNISVASAPTTSHKPGSVILYDLAPKDFTSFLFWDTVCFLASLSIIVALIRMPLRSDSMRWTFVRLEIYAIAISVQLVFIEAVELTTNCKIHDLHAFLIFFVFWMGHGLMALYDVLQHYLQA